MNKYVGEPKVCNTCLFLIKVTEDDVVSDNGQFVICAKCWDKKVKQSEKALKEAELNNELPF